ncbi:methylated-DNA--[protein]-cysteine S-methyltransferase [Bacteroides gallinaceum]|uniref:Methylated-DNA--protein-cysteine methyltransferase n=1 Tax=Bacteroides gallinaceum TaxID=1462571 RepID=A0ABT7X6Q3_9BACE|nr:MULTISPECIES: methylated-DNA--[protein]-cysteine S-methyltransferase [Bacteroides]MBM6946032.1 methylated-DNA--[protein]-cysteine S-methyltransferase [Bacteroides gallinaceum]MDN0049710.1 methylated-DNA--[protein]-cysteine S-methyltransferase [Bacteroides gallinaceum]OUO51963.1 6-O-methylguanine DNA methyltransferase [Bacteroides sp. An279]
MNGYLYKCLSPLGDITLASNGEALTGLWFDGQKYFDPALTATYVEKELPVFVETLEWLERYFNRELPGVPPALQPQGSPFRQAVWNILKEIPYGQTVTYKDIAQKLARQKGVEHFSAQAVGGAIGHNPISILIPCHRVIGSNGNLTGYAGGLWRKEKLLELEREHFLSRNA